MANSRKDSKGMRLRDGECERKDGRYTYRYTDNDGKRKSIYAHSLKELRDKEKQLERDIADDIITDETAKKLTLNTLFERYMEIHEVSESTKVNQKSAWNNHVRNTLGQYKVVQLRPSNIKKLYSQMSKDGYAKSTIKIVQNILHPVLEMAVDDDIIRKNPANKSTWNNYGCETEEKKALTRDQQKRLMEFLRSDTIYNVYCPMLTIMLGTGVRCGELVGLTWNDIDFEKSEISINHQLIYKNFGDGCKLHVSKPKTDAGIRTIPMTKQVKKAFHDIRKQNFLLGKAGNVEIEGYTDFIFITRNGNPLLPCSVNKILNNIVDALNKSQPNEAEPFPAVAAHIMRHTFCTRMAEQGMDIKVLQYIMGHANINVTMEVYNHISDMTRVERELEKLESLAVNF